MLEYEGYCEKCDTWLRYTFEKCVPLQLKCSECQTVIQMVRPVKKEDKGIKYDDGKPRYSLLPVEPLEELARVYTFGANKYEENNWRKGFQWSRAFSAIMRHCWAFWRGEDVDPESGLHHLAHAAFGCFALIEYGRKNTGDDDRYETGNS